MNDTTPTPFPAAPYPSITDPFLTDDIAVLLIDDARPSPTGHTWGRW